MTKRGMLIVLSGPSGVGKGTVRKALFDEGDTDFQYSISMTTRQPREGEKNGVDYFFVSKEQFEDNIQNGEMLEYAKYVDNYYGTPLNYVNETLDSGKDVFLEIEVNGAMQVRANCPDAVFVFLTPPDLMELKHRLINRGTEDIEVINARIKKAVGEIKMMRNYDYAVVNDEVENAVTSIRTIIRSERLRVTRVMPDYEQMIGEDD
ncbi:guanylate kinase [Secundilactobacillus collinoides]|uniref:Guanylate kinase n=2 Tax=Secundilactobacillus collinoides TaxID=33960 RepID=A0A0R2BPZ4_SECCO|nr:guanylate kinase [Secundilactobacillus collinoides]KRM77363.1 guanylate kinase [Secundilactobacillus collinoides DSM 20515 = JCM 1123]KZL40475.1 guanylate kinase [Secundilactobacillus collinoides]